MSDSCLLKMVLYSSIIRKIVMALTGFALVSFLLVHLLGNLTLFSNNPNLFNQYADTLHKMGILLIIAEIMLVCTFLVHIIYAILVTLQNQRARKQGYVKEGNAGGPSQKSFASKTMIITGILVAVFIIFHISMFKYGQHTNVPNTNMRDLYTVVQVAFSNPMYVALYVLALIILGIHLQHAVLSAFRSLGIEHYRYSKFLILLSRLMAFVITVGFLSIPIWMYLSRFC